MDIMNRSAPENGVKNSVPGVDLFRVHFEYAHYGRTDIWSEVSRSISRVDPFIMRIYFAHVFVVSVARAQFALLSAHLVGTNQSLTSTMAYPGFPPR